MPTATQLTIIRPRGRRRVEEGVVPGYSSSMRWLMLSASLFGLACSDNTSNSGANPSDRDAVVPVDGSVDGPDASLDTGTDADLGTDAQSDGGADNTPDVPPSSAFSFIGYAEEPCPLSTLQCSNYWPDKADGTVYLFRSEEVSGQGTHERSFYVYVPIDSLPANALIPMVLYLHGGTGEALDWFRQTPVVPLADARGENPGVTWQRNTPDCTFYFESFQSFGFQDSHGSSCTPEEVTFTNSQRYVAVFPDGILDDGATAARHWEDGRSPSPGWDVVEQQRDDLGFVDHVIDVLLQEQSLTLDPERIYVAGGSNGGMMTHRLLCNLDSASYPNLKRITATAAYTSGIPEPLSMGLDGRETCNSSGPVIMPIFYVMGNNIDTPNCQPYGCDSPVINGDGLVPFGQPGGTYFIASPDGGRSISALDTLQHWVDYDVQSGSGSMTTASGTIGQFTKTESTTFASSPGEILFFEVDGGHHYMVGQRADFSIWGRSLDFMFRFRRDANGGLSRSATSGIDGVL